MEYKILYDRDIYFFQKQVQEHLDDGYKLHGHMSITPYNIMNNGSDDYLVFWQVVIKAQ